MISKDLTEKDVRVDRTANRSTVEAIYVPDVDLVEAPDKIWLTADLPGVGDKDADVTVENGVLRIEGRAVYQDVPQGYVLVEQEFAPARYRREFSLSNKVSAEGIKARMAHGVLNLSIPKREEVKARKIAIES